LAHTTLADALDEAVDDVALDSGPVLGLAGGWSAVHPAASTATKIPDDTSHSLIPMRHSMTATRCPTSANREAEGSRLEQMMSVH